MAFNFRGAVSRCPLYLFRLALRAENGSSGAKKDAAAIGAKPAGEIEIVGFYYACIVYFLIFIFVIS